MRGTSRYGWLKQPQLRVMSLAGFLFPDESERASRFYFQTDRERFIVARGMLRLILGQYLKLKPDILKFGYSLYGKPYLEREAHPEDFLFNISHSGDLAIIAVGRGREIEVDIERIRPDVLEDKIAERFFSRLEVSMLLSLPAESQIEAFFNCWTRKEAYIKARDEGLSLPLADFDVSLTPGEPAILLGTRLGDSELSRWDLQELVVGTDYAAALVVEGRNHRLRCLQWPD